MAQLLNFTSLTLVARVFGTEAVGQFSFLYAFATLVAIISTLRMETTLVQARKIAIIYRNATAGIISCVSLNVLIIIIGLTVNNFWVVCIGVLAIGLSANSIIVNILIARSKFMEMSIVRIANAVFILFIVLMGIKLGYDQALIMAYAAGQILGALTGFFLFTKMLPYVALIFSLPRVLDVYKNHLNFITFNGTQSIISGIQETVVVYLINHYLGLSALGVYELCKRILRAPTSIIAEAVGRVLQVRFRAQYSRSPMAAERLLRQFIFYLIVGGCVIILAIFFLAEPLFFLLKINNTEALSAQLIAMSVYFSFVFIASSISAIPLAVGKPESVAIRGSVGSVLYCVLIFLGLEMGLSLPMIFYCVSAIMSIHFVLFIRGVMRSVAT